MKRITAPIVLAILLIASPVSSQKWKYSGELIGVPSSRKGYMGYKQLPKQARQYFEDMSFIPSGSFMGGEEIDIVRAGEKDSCLVTEYAPNMYSVDAFFISEHEVTNAEYREFTSWVRAKALNEGSDLNHLKFKALVDFIVVDVPVLPDTTCWTTDFMFSYNEPLANLYFWHPAYDNYPVVGVSYYQALAYCQWKTDRLNEQILIANKHLEMPSYSFTTHGFLQSAGDDFEEYYLLYPDFRLPKEAEWEHAALGGLEQSGYSLRGTSFPWRSSPGDYKNGLYLANFGAITDVNGQIIKDLVDDGYMTTSEIQSYKANEYGLYDMLGNVAEWVQDNIPPVHWSESNIREENQLPKRIVKGGSWYDGPAYLIPSVKSIHHAKKQSSMIGFRVAMNYGYQTY